MDEIRQEDIVSFRDYRPKKKYVGKKVWIIPDNYESFVGQVVKCTLSDGEFGEIVYLLLETNDGQLVEFHKDDIKIIKVL